MKNTSLMILLLITVCSFGIGLKKDKTQISAPAQLTDKKYLFEVVRHLYRWYFEESEIEKIVSEKTITFWIREIKPKLDAGDKSEFGEIILPQLSIFIKVKRADYTIEEINSVVKSNRFKIVEINRKKIPAKILNSCHVANFDMNEMRDYLFRTRSQQDFPDTAMIEHLRSAVRREMQLDPNAGDNLPQGDRTVYLASISPVANEEWVFWEDGRKLLFFASDIDLANPAVWEHETLTIKIFNLDKQVVVSLQEAQGSNMFLTRYQVSRALFNCIVLGKRVSIPPPCPDGASAGSSSRVEHTNRP